ncbi:MAG TPA: SDR family oxidoreductase [Vicinamibacterales bacterium]|nr:SDR family oxidoreductase [Vicinamibacterales bacterium]
MNQAALVTGASSGIGRALAREFAAHGFDVVLVARREEALRDVSREIKGRVHLVAMDLAGQGAGTALADEVQRRGIQVDVAVNNAGFGLQGEFSALPLDRQLEMIQLNVTTLTELTRRLLPGMLERRSGGILNVASTAAFQPGPLMAVYYATKAYVLSFTEAITEELAGRGVKISCLCPGPTHSEFAARADMQGTPLFRGRVMDAETVARAGYEGWMAGEAVIVPGAANRRGTWLVRLAPRAMVRRIVKGLNTAKAVL